MTALLAAMVNGVKVSNPAQAIAIGDRGVNYGDGLFETTLLQRGTVRFLDAHLARLREGCRRLGIAYPSELAEDLDDACGTVADGVLKIVLTRGTGGRGYRTEPTTTVTRIVSVHPLPPSGPGAGLTVRWCHLQLGRNAMLAGIKHLNRLEQVLARSEWSDDSIDEGLLLDTEGEVVSATAANVFIVRQGTLLTPDLRFCGVRGVMRGQVLRAAAELGIPCSEEPLWPHDFAGASEIFLTNAVRGIRAVTRLDEQQWQAGPVSLQLKSALER